MCALVEKIGGDDDDDDYDDDDDRDNEDHRDKLIVLQENDIWCGGRRSKRPAGLTLVAVINARSDEYQNAQEGVERKNIAASIVATITKENKGRFLKLQKGGGDEEQFTVMSNVEARANIVACFGDCHRNLKKKEKASNKKKKRSDFVEQPKAKRQNS